MGILHPEIEKIQEICRQLDLELQERPKVNRKIVATMYYLAAQRLRHAFGGKVSPLTDEQRNIYALSGFKKPLNNLINTTFTSTDLAERMTLQNTLHGLLIQFEDRYYDITHLKLVNQPIIETNVPILFNDLDKQLGF